MKTILFALLVLSRVDGYRNALDSFAVDVELTSTVTGVDQGTNVKVSAADSNMPDVELTSTAPDGRHETSKFRVYGKGSDRSIVEFTAPQTEKGKYLLMLRDAMWIYMPSASRPIRISPRTSLPTFALDPEKLLAVRTIADRVRFHLNATTQSLLEHRQQVRLLLCQKARRLRIGVMIEQRRATRTE